MLSVEEGSKRPMCLSSWKAFHLDGDTLSAVSLASYPTEKCQADDRQESCSSAGDCQADEQTHPHKVEI